MPGEDLPRVRELKKGRLLLFGGGTVFLVWSVAILIVVLIAPTVTQATAVDAPKSFSDLATLLFGATSIALIILSFVISILAIVGWSHLRQSIREDVAKAAAEAKMELKESSDRINQGMRDETSRANKEIRDETTNAIKDLKAEITSATEMLRREVERLDSQLLGRMYSNHGHMQGRTALRQDRPEPINTELLREAVNHCHIGYKLLGAASKGSAGEFMALNNLIFYASLYEATNPEIIPGATTLSVEWLLKMARLLLQASKEHDDGSPRGIDLHLTYCCAMNLLSKDTTEISTALGLTRGLATRRDASTSQRAEARYYEDSLSEKLKQLPPSTG